MKKKEIRPSLTFLVVVIFTVMAIISPSSQAGHPQEDFLGEDQALSYPQLPLLTEMTPIIQKLDRYSRPVTADLTVKSEAERPPFKHGPTGGQTFVKGKSYGRLKIITEGELKQGLYKPQDILLLSKVADNLNPVAGIISTGPQVPYTNLMFRALNMKTPFVYAPGALALTSVSKNAGRLVELEVKEGGLFTIKGEESFPAGVLAIRARNYQKQRVPHLSEPIYDLNTKVLFIWSKNKMTTKDIPAYGAKGINFALMDNILRRKDPAVRRNFEAGLLVPFYYYYQHVTQGLTSVMCQSAFEECDRSTLEKKSCKEILVLCKGTVTGKDDGATTLWDFMDTLVGGGEDNQLKTRMESEGHFRRAGLRFIRGLIEIAPMDDESLAYLRDSISRSFHSQMRIRLRPSTNVDNDNGLSAAGLYSSQSVCLRDITDDKTDLGRRCFSEQEMAHKRPKKLPSLPVAIKRVFSSVWSEQAFLNRTFHKLNHFKVFMGLLVHPAIMDERANGVALVRRDPKTRGMSWARVIVKEGKASVARHSASNRHEDHFKAFLEGDRRRERTEYQLRPGGSFRLLKEAHVSELLKQIDATLLGLHRLEKWESLLKLDKVHRDQLKEFPEMIDMPQNTLEDILVGVSASPVRERGPKEKMPIEMKENSGPGDLFSVEFVLSADGKIVLRQVRPMGQSTELGEDFFPRHDARPYLTPPSSVSGEDG